jgi:hypothetical protein
MMECIIFEFRMLFRREKEEIRRVRMKMKHNRKVLFITSIRISEKCYHHEHNEATLWLCSFDTFTSTRGNVWNGKKNKVAVFCLLHSPKKNSWYLCVKPLTLFLLTVARKIVCGSFQSSSFEFEVKCLDCCHITHHQVCDFTFFSWKDFCWWKKMFFFLLLCKVILIIHEKWFLLGCKLFKLFWCCFCYCILLNFMCRWRILNWKRWINRRRRPHSHESWLLP